MEKNNSLVCEGPYSEGTREFCDNLYSRQREDKMNTEWVSSLKEDLQVEQQFRVW